MLKKEKCGLDRKLHHAKRTGLAEGATNTTDMREKNKYGGRICESHLYSHQPYSFKSVSLLLQLFLEVRFFSAVFI